jgi:hypothetical protein
MSEQNRRDTQFLGSAQRVRRAIFEKLNMLDFGFSAEQQASFDRSIDMLIARYAFDIVGQVIDHAPASVSDADDWDIPDLPMWQEEQA